jgi:hypothetical protein
MKVLEGLGRSGNSPVVFQYRRFSGGVEIDMGIGLTQNKGSYTITAAHWQSILDALRNSTSKLFQLTPGTQGPANSSLSEILDQVFGAGVLDDSFKACIFSILENEGSVELYHGVAGPGQGVQINVRKDVV